MSTARHRRGWCKRSSSSRALLPILADRLCLADAREQENLNKAMAAQRQVVGEGSTLRAGLFLLACAGCLSVLELNMVQTSEKYSGRSA